jgi:hypothetical protein
MAESGTVKTGRNRRTPKTVEQRDGPVLTPDKRRVVPAAAKTRHTAADKAMRV